MKKLLLFGVFLGTLAAVTPAHAQSDKPVWVNLGGSVSVPSGEIGDRFGTGGAFNFGVIFQPLASPAGFQVEYEYHKLAGKETSIPTIDNGLPSQALIESHHDMHVINFNGLFQPSGDASVKPYGIGGFGITYRTVSLTTPSVGLTTWCDPYWYVCYPVAVEVDQIIGDRSSWDPGFNIGAGVTFRMGDSAQFYVEGRWQYVWGPEFTDRNGDTQKANSQYFPITFGFRF